MKVSDHVVRYAAASGSLQKLQWAHSVRGGGGRAISLPIDTTDYAGRGGSVEMMQWLAKLYVFSTDKTVLEACEHGHLPLVQHLLQNTRHAFS